jgi:hypothetical protein
MADMQAATPDARVIEFLDICRALASGGVAEESTTTKNV